MSSPAAKRMGCTARGEAEGLLAKKMARSNAPLHLNWVHCSPHSNDLATPSEGNTTKASRCQKPRPFPLKMMR